MPAQWSSHDTTYGTSPASLAGPISDRVVKPVALIQRHSKYDIFHWYHLIIAYPLPRPGTYPRGAGWPRNDFLFLPTNMGGGWGGMGTSRCILFYTTTTPTRHTRNMNRLWESVLHVSTFVRQTYNRNGMILIRHFTRAVCKICFGVLLTCYLLVMHIVYG